MQRFSTGGVAPRKFMGIGAAVDPAPAPVRTPEEDAKEAAAERLEAAAADDKGGPDSGAEAQAALADGADPNDDGGVALAMAAAAGNTHVMRCILDAPTVRLGDIGQRALSAAATYGHVPAVKLLLATGKVAPSADTNFAAESAVARGFKDVVTVLAEHHAFDATAELYPGRIVRIAALYGREVVLRAVLAAGFPLGDEGDALTAAAEGGHVEAMRILLEDPRVDPTVGDFSAARGALRSGAFAALPLLCGAAPAFGGSDQIAGRFLACAVATGSVKALAAALAVPGVLPSAHRNVALRKAVYRRDADMCKALLAHPALDLGSVDGTLAKIAEVIHCLSDSPEIATAIFDHPSALRLPVATRAAAMRAAARDAVIMYAPAVAAALQAGMSPVDAASVALFGAATHRDVDAVHTLLAAGIADPSLDDDAALEAAAGADCAGAITALLADSRVDAIAHGAVAVARAVDGKCEEALKALLADLRIDPTCGGGNAPLRRAMCYHGGEAIVELLRADPRVQAGEPVPADGSGSGGFSGRHREDSNDDKPPEVDYVWSDCNLEEGFK